MSRSSTAQRTGPYRLPLLSASQEKQTACWRRWGYDRLMGLKEPFGEAAQRGTGHHAELEAWSLFGKMPTTKPALAALRYAPPKGLDAGIEVPVRFDTPSSPWVGYIDACFDWEVIKETYGLAYGNPIIERTGKMRPLGSTGWTVIQDYKFTGSLRNAKTAEELLDDSAANIYAYEAFLGGAERVSGRWVYVQMNGSATVDVVWFDFDRKNVERIVDQLDGKAKQIQAYYSAYRRGELVVHDLPYDTSQCYAYKQQCPRMDDHCRPQLTVSLSLFGANKMQDFKAAITEGFPGMPVKSTSPAAPPKLPPRIQPAVATAAPKLPPKKPIDAAWDQHSKDLTAPESGFVNSPEAPAVAASSPEHAAALQGVSKPAEQAPAQAAPVTATADELDGYARDQLVALAVSLGAVPEKSRARAPALREAIRAFRAKQPETEVREAFSAPGAVESIAMSASFGQALGTWLPPKIAPKEDLTESGVREVQPAETQADESALDESLGASFTLYINCAPAFRNLEMRDVLEAANKIVKEERGVDDYRLIGYGEGPGVLCLAVKRMHEQGFFTRFDSLVIDSRTAEGSVLLETLSSLASEIVRSF